MTSLHFLRPAWFFALLPIAIWLWCIVKKHWKDNHWQQVCEPKLLSRLLLTMNKQQHRWPFCLLALVWIMSVIALAGPTWSLIAQPIYRGGIARILVLDVSTNTAARDVLPSRFVRAKYKIQDMLTQSREDSVGMVAFTAEPFVVSPLTEDSKTILNLLPDLYPDMMPVQGSNISAALEQAAQLMHQGTQQRHQEILLVSGSVARPNDKETAKKIATSGIPISVLAVMVDTAPEKQSLQQLAQAGGGRFALMSNGDDDIRQLWLVGLPGEAQEQVTKETADVWQDEGYWLVLIILPFALLVFRRGWLSQVLR